MISTSNEFKEKLNNGARVVNYADITLSDGTVLHLEPKDFMGDGCTIEDKTTDGKFGVGFVIGRTLTLRIANHDERFSIYDFYRSIIYLYIAMAMGDGSVEKIRKGVYYTLMPETPGDTIEISAVDRMYKLDTDYSASGTIYPATLQIILSEACADCGIPVGFRQFDNMGFVVNEKPENVTYRQVVSWVCQIAGYNARIDNDGYMQLTWYNTELLNRYTYDGGGFNIYPHDTVIDGGDFKDYSADTILSGGLFTDEMPEHIYLIKSLSTSTDDVQITGVRVIGEEDVSELFGEEGYLIEIKDNRLALGKEREVADHLGMRMVGMVFRPFSAEILNNPLYEPFEVVRVSDRKGNVYVSLINSVSYKINGYTQVACQAEDPVRNGSSYFSEAAAAVVEARRDTEKQITEYDKAVQNMNELAANAMGLFRKEELQANGSYISYESDRPITVDENGKCHFEPGSHVWMKSDAGFFVSEDGGETYTAGLDKNNNAVLNVLYAIGIDADWIRTGRFVVKKGNTTTFLADVDTGEVRIVADSFSLTSGKTIEDIAEDRSNIALDIAKEFTSGELQKYSSQFNSSLTVVNDRIAAEVTRATAAEGVIDGNIKTVNENLSSKIDQTAESIASTVSKTYETKTDAESRYSSLSSKIDQTANNITLSVSSTYETKSDATSKYDSFGSQLSVMEGKISSKVSAGDVTSLIEQSVDTIRLKADNIMWRSTYSSMDKYGFLTCTGGNIGGFTIGSTKIYGTSSDGKVIAMQKGSGSSFTAFAAGGTSHDSYSDCPFRVTMGGKLYATEAVISGNSTFSGKLSAASGTFSGELSGATGAFTGSLTTGASNQTQIKITGHTITASYDDNSNSARINFPPYNESLEVGKGSIVITAPNGFIVNGKQLA